MPTGLIDFIVNFFMFCWELLVMDTNGASLVDYQAKSFQIASANLSQFHASHCTTHLAITWEPSSTSFFLLTSSSTPPKDHQLLLPTGISPPKQDSSPHTTQTYWSSVLTHTKFASHTKICFLRHCEPPQTLISGSSHKISSSSHNVPILLSHLLSILACHINNYTIPGLGCNGGFSRLNLISDVLILDVLGSWTFLSCQR